MKKAKDQEIIVAFEELNSCRKVANKLGMCPQSVHERLVRLGLNKHINVINEQDLVLIKNLYDEGFKRGDGKLKELAQKLGRNVQFIARKAKKMGLTSQKRLCNEDIKKALSKRIKRWMTENPHPKGMLGKKQTINCIDKLKVRVKKYYEDLTPEQKALQYTKMVNTQRKKGNYDRKHGSWSSAWRTIGGKTKFFRSSWEANYARYLEYLKTEGQILEWEHEPETFWFLNILRGARSYLPDFKVTNLDCSHYWVEVKGWMDSRSKTKIKRFAKYYPLEKLVLIQAPWFKINSPKFESLLEGWERKK